MNNKIYKSSLFIFYLLLFYSFYCALNSGLSIDENFHHINGEVRYLYLVNIGDFDKYDFNNNRYYPGLVDTIHYILFKIISGFLDIKFLVEIKHSINFIFASFGLFGLFLLTKKTFNKEIAIFSCIITLLNPFYFGHMGINPKDPVLFTFLIWTLYFLVKYLENINSDRIKYLLFLALMIGLGSNTRLTFLSLLFPVILICLYYAWKKTQNLKLIFFDISIILLITFLTIIIVWPHFHNGGYELIFENIKESSNWGKYIFVKYGLINGEFYEIINTPRNYIFKIVVNRLPIFIILLFISSYLVLYYKKEYLTLNTNPNSLKYFIILNIIIYWPILVVVVGKIHLYDNLRLFTFLLPFISVISAISLWYLIDDFKNSKIYIKFFVIILLFFNILFFVRFVSIAPYQYIYVNHLSAPKFNSSKNMYEHDYWLASVGELIYKIKLKYGKDSSNLKIALCGGRALTHGYYFASVLKNFNIYDHLNADYVIVSNRNFNQEKKTCDQKFPGKDILNVEKNNLVLSAFRKIKK